jgi:hypothetical protein
MEREVVHDHVHAPDLARHDLEQLSHEDAAQFAGGLDHGAI